MNTTGLWRGALGGTLGGLAAGGIVVMGGCASWNAPDLQTERLAAESMGLPEPIVFRVDGGPLDEAEDPARLSLARAIQLAAETDPGLQAALARVRGALADARQARLLPNPVLNLALRFPEGGGSPVVEASLAADLLAILTIPRRADAADHRLRRASAGAVVVALDLVAEVEERYAAVVWLEKSVVVLEARAALMAQATGVAAARLQAGETGADETLALLVGNETLEAQAAGVREAARDARLRLARLIGRPSGEALWELEEWGETVGEWRPPGGGERGCVEAALQRRPEVWEATWHLAALGDERAVSGMAWLEGSDVGASAERDGGNWSVGPEVSVPLPVFDVGQEREARADAERIAARHELVRVQRAVVEDVRRSLEAATRAHQNADRFRRGIAGMQERRVANATAAYEAGAAEWSAVVEAKNAALETALMALEAERREAETLVRLRRAVGGAGVDAGKASEEEGEKKR